MRAPTTKSPGPLSKPQPSKYLLYRALGALVPSIVGTCWVRKNWTRLCPGAPNGDLQRNVLACGDGDERLSGTSTLALRTQNLKTLNPKP